MADLITVAELEALGVTTSYSSLVESLISAASDEIIDAAGTPILESRGEVTLTAMPGKVLPLPGLPIREIHSVKIDGVEITDWTQIAHGIHRSAGFSREELERVTVDYTHGLTSVPHDIKLLVVAMVLAGLPEDGESVRDRLSLNNGMLSSVAIDDYKEAYATGADVEAITPMTLPERARARLAARFGSGGPKVRGAL